jgi:hypothetical protein
MGLMRTRPAPLLDYAPPQARVLDATTLVALAVVFAAHCAIQFVLWRGRMISNWWITESDFVLLPLPNLLATASYAVIFIRFARKRPWSLREKITFVVLLTLATGFISFWMSMLVPVNTYGS